MKIEVIAIGTELLTPYFQDTNSLYLAQRLNDLGFEISFKTIVGDNWENLIFCIEKAIAFSDLVIAMGGLGPTDDDKTREAFAEVLKKKLIFQEDILKKIEERFRRRGMVMPAANRKQAYIIEGAEVLENKNGTAPGLWLETGKKKIVLLPGPPHELRPMCEESVWPRLKEICLGFMARKTIKITGLTESEVEGYISDCYPKTKELNLTILAYPGQIEIHLAACSTKSPVEVEEKIQNLENKILARLKENIFSTSGEELEEVVGKLLRQRHETLAAAESCTGGLLSHRLTNIPGSSDYFLLGVTAYSNSAKNQWLGVPPELLQKYGAVSAEVVQAMASSVREKAKTSFGLAITGIAGPSGGTKEKPVGLVYTALSWEGGVEVKKNIFLGKRDLIKFQSSQIALDMLRRFLLHQQNKE